MSKTKNSKATKKGDESKLTAALKKLNLAVNRQTHKEEEVDSLWRAVFKALEESDVKDKEEIRTDFRNQRWTTNHMKIKSAIDQHVREYNSMPSSFKIASELGLSRQTVSKHFKEFSTHELYSEEMLAIEFASNMLLERVLAIAARGDLKAMQFYINTVEKRKEAAKKGVTNNFIQVNNIFVNEETIKALPVDKRQAIEEIILSENLSLLVGEKVEKVDKS